jgi:hypothetical protein
MKILRWANQGVMLLLGLMIVLDGGMLLYWKAVGDDSTRTADVQNVDHVYRLAGTHGSIAPPEGYTAAGVKVSIGSKSRSGWAVRYGTEKCEYCRQDKPRWVELSTALQRLGYQVVYIPPYANLGYPDDALTPSGARQQVYVGMEWIRHFRLVVTPTVLIFGPEGQLIWSHRGTLSSDGPQSAVRAIEAARRRAKGANMAGLEIGK